MIVLLFFILFTTALTCPENCLYCFAASPFCLACNSGYQLNLQSACTPQSNVPHCAHFQNQTHCSTCQPTFSLRNNSCFKDYSGCVISDSSTGQCLACGFGTVLSNGSCLGVLQCNQSGQTCSDCQEGWNLTQGRCFDATGKCSSVGPQGICLQCVEGFKLIGYECVPNNLTLVSCYIYTSAGVCLICKDGYYLYQNDCFTNQEINNIYSGSSTPRQILSQRTLGTNKTSETSYINQNITNSLAPQPRTPNMAISNINSNIHDQSTGSIPSNQSQGSAFFSSPLNCQVFISNLCFQCHEGYFLNKQSNCRPNPSNCAQSNVQGQGCLKCTEGYILKPSNHCIAASNIQHCLQFTDNGYCTQCGSGYYLRKNVCMPFSLYCTSYNLATGECLSCLSGLSLFNQNCTDPNCVVGVAGDCSRCRDGFTISGNPSICRAIEYNVNNCISYSSGGGCLACSQGYILNAGACLAKDNFTINCLGFSNLTGRCISCRQGYILSPTFICQPLTRDLNCIRYQNGACLNCSNRYYFSPQDQKCVPVNPLCQNYNIQGQCISCYAGYRLQLGSCIIGSPENHCQQTNNNSACLKCYAGYYLNNGQCLPQNPLCKTYTLSNSSCTSCYPGYSLSNGQCQVTRGDPNCKQFSQNGACLACYQGFFVSNSLGRCTQVSPLCKGSDGSGRCLDCYPGYSLSNGQCVVGSHNNCLESSNGVCSRCYSGYYLTPMGACQQVNPLCKTYTNVTGACTSCYPGYNLSQGQCTIATNNIIGQGNCARRDSNNICTACYKGYFLNSSKICQKVSDLCKTFDITTGACTSCYQGYKLDQNGLCVISQTNTSGPDDPYCLTSSRGICTQCAAGYYLKVDKSCELANPLCKEVNSLNQCTSCYLGYTLTEGQCILATIIYLPFCLKQSGSLCLQCLQGYYTKQGQCVSVSILCATYDQQTGQCYSCVQGYVFQQGECIQPSFGVDPNCQYYTGSFCSICIPGYKLLNYWCTRSQDPNCLQHDSGSGNCVSCVDNLRPSGPSCI